MAPQQDNKPANSRGPLNPSLHNKAEKYCITCGDSNSISLCSRCRGVWYCDNNNKKCQRADWPCHKLLCSKYAKSNEIEPLDDAYRAFLFRTDSLKPEMIILPTSWHRSYDMNPVRELFRQPGDDEYGPSVDRCDFGFSCRLNDRHIGKDGIQVIVRDRYKLDGSKANKSILASVRAIGTAHPPTFWGGNIVVRRIKPLGGPKTATMADFRHAIDWLAMYPRHQYYEFLQAPATGLASARFWKFSDIKGVMIAGDLSTKDESERYKAVSVPYDRMIRGLATELRGDISPISERIGRPLRLLMTPTKLRHLDPNGGPPLCTPADWLMRSIKKDTNGRLPQLTFSLPKGTVERGTLPYIDQALVISADDKDLSVKEVRAMVHFSESLCHEVIRNVTLTPTEDTTGL